MEEVKNIEKAEDRSLYEVSFHILPSYSEEDMMIKYEEIKKSVTKHNGTITTEGAPSMTDLAYTMIKVLDNKHVRFDTAYFGWLQFEMGAQDIVALKEELDQNIDILRFLIINTVDDAEIQAPTILKEEKMPEKKIDAPHEKEDSAPIVEKELDDKIDEMIEE